METLSDITFFDESRHQQRWNAAESSLQVRSLAEELRHCVPAGQPIGLLFRSGPLLPSAWLACLHAGLEPLILQYPTRKQTRLYWADSVINTINLTGLSLILAEDETLGRDLPCKVRVIDEVRIESGKAQPVRLPDDFAIIQLSSGTTGYRKALRFTSDDLRRHIDDFNCSLGLTHDDHVASWLPLYHDMGYIACFVMPLLLGIPISMIDPMVWVSKPELLFDVIEQQRATTCYMPNFGFEVLRRLPPRPCPSMRRWISAGETVSPETMRRFGETHAVPDAALLALYGAAENIFAITIGRAETVKLGGRDLASCGPPIPGVDIKFVDEEVWVRSPVSLKSYLNGSDIRDEEGFYASGDLGTLVDGRLIVHGRRRDLIVQAGRKFLLSDLDQLANDMIPDARGRLACIGVSDSQVGTETAMILIEDTRFYARQDAGMIASSLCAASGLASAAVHFVPPRFVTKTSSGKINRKLTGAHWQACQNVEKTKAQGFADTDPFPEFASLDRKLPVGETLDSLSLAVLSVQLAEMGVTLDPGKTLDQLKAMRPEVAPAGRQAIRIVSLADRFSIPAPDESQLEALAAALGVEVTFEHICLPPSPVLLSDLIFGEYFAPRAPDLAMDSVFAARQRLKQASLIIADDMSELFYLYESTYPVLSHRLERSPAADLISMRWQSYVRNHHLLPIEAVAGIDLPMSASTASLDALSALLGCPVFRVATLAGLANFTESWECHTFAHVPRSTGVAGRNSLVWSKLRTWICEKGIANLLRPRRAGPPVVAVDPPHFCSCAVNPDAIQAIADHFDSFLVFGQEASLPFLRQQIEARGKPFTLLPSYAQESLNAFGQDAACFVACGAFGPIVTERPFVALQHIGSSPRLRNLGGFESSLPSLNTPVESGTSWYHDFPLSRLSDYETWSQVRRSMAA